MPNLVESARGLLGSGRVSEARAACEASLRATPANFDAWLLLGMVAVAERRLAEAQAAFGRAVVLRPNHLEALGNLGAAQLTSGEFAGAAATFRRALARFPRVAALHHNLGRALQHAGDLEGAAASYGRAAALEPARSAAYRDQASALEGLGKLDAALAAGERATALAPNDALAHFNVGVVLERLGRLESAAEAYGKAVALDASHPAALSNFGAVLHRLGHLEAARQCLDRALALRPEFPDAWANRGLVLLDSHEHEQALASFDRALALAPRHAAALNGWASAQTVRKRHEEAAEAFARLLDVAPDFDYALGSMFFARANCCDWRDRAKLVERLRTAVRDCRRASQPFSFLLASDDPGEQRACAELFAAAECPPAPVPVAAPARYGHDRPRIAYLSADWHDHATAYLMAELLERHDRAAFDVTVVSLGPPSVSPMRARLEAAVETFVDWRTESDRTIAERLRALEIDIAVDLKGYTQNARPGILAHRPAPVQVAFLGYPGTTGAPYIDYLIADPELIPSSEQPHYSERVVYLPECYQPNDRARAIAERTPSRAELGLPDDAFVFCSFNDGYKITPDVFAVWLRLLAGTPGSVLWLLEPNAAAVVSLRAAAERGGVAPERLVFAPRLPLAEHLARHRRADLFLDTLPVNAHTTASDALWAGLPLLTCRGRAMAARVAASLLVTVGLPELVTDSLVEYERRALELAADRAVLAALRARLESAREASPLFDAERFRRHLERAFAGMLARHAAGHAPESFAVAAVPRAGQC